MIVLKQNTIRILGLIFIISILFQLIDNTIPRLYYSVETLVYQVTGKADEYLSKSYPVTNKISYTDYHQGGGDPEKFMEWCVDEMDGEVIRTADNAYCVSVTVNIIKKKEVKFSEFERRGKDIKEFMNWCEEEGGTLTRDETGEALCVFTYRGVYDEYDHKELKDWQLGDQRRLSIWFKENLTLSISITTLGLLILFLIQIKLLYHLFILFSRFHPDNYLTYKNVNDLQNIVLCFILIPTIYLIIFKDFRLDSFVLATLALILYQFLNYGLVELEMERQELENQDKSFI